MTQPPAVPQTDLPVPPPPPPATDLQQPPIVPADLLSGNAQPPASAPTANSANRIRLFRIQPGFLSDPVELDSDDKTPGGEPTPSAPDDGPDWINVAIGNDNPFFDFRRRTDPGGVAYMVAKRLLSQFMHDLARELAPYLETGPAGPRLLALVDELRRSDVRSLDFVVAINQRVQQLVRYLIRMQPGVQPPEQPIVVGSGLRRQALMIAVSVDPTYIVRLERPGAILRACVISSVCSVSSQPWLARHI